MNDHTELLNKIEELAGPQRAKTFRAFAAFAIRHRITFFVETGTCREACDGQSTIILAMLARAMFGTSLSIDINGGQIEKAKALLANQQLHSFVNFLQGDSVEELGRIGFPVQALYLDSFDHDPSNPGPCQRHELAEIGAIYGQLKKPCAILLDDCIPETGGKTKLGSAFLEDRGWVLAAKGYQLLYTLE